MYQVFVYSITPKLWRWDIRCGSALLRCGTAANQSRCPERSKLRPQLGRVPNER